MVEYGKHNFRSTLCRRFRQLTLRHMGVDMGVGMCVGMCVDTGVDLGVNMCVDMCAVSVPDSWAFIVGRQDLLSLDTLNHTIDSVLKSMG